MNAQVRFQLKSNLPRSLAAIQTGMLHCRCMSSNHTVLGEMSDCYDAMQTLRCSAHTGHFHNLNLALLLLVLFLPLSLAKDNHLAKAPAGVIPQKSSFQNKNVANKIRPHPGLTIYQPQAPRLNLSADRNTLQIGEEVTFTLTPANLVTNSHLKFTFNFGDGAVLDLEPGRSDIVHFYKKAGPYKVSVEIFPSVGNKLSGPTPVEVKVNGFSLTASPMKVEVGQEVSFQAKPVSKDPNIRYMFDFGDSTKTDWQSESQAVHRYSSGGKYSPAVEIGRIKGDGSVESFDKVTTKPVTVTPPKKPSPTNNSVTPSPPPSDPKKEGEFPWWTYPVLVLIAGLASVATLFAAHRIHKWLFPPRPTFHAYPDSGNSYFKPGTGLTIDAQLRLNANTANGLYQLATEETKFIRSGRRKHV